MATLILYISLVQISSTENVTKLLIGENSLKKRTGLKWLKLL